MEIHAQHLHKVPGKNFWHYFFEFCMLFIAVFCGFLAENFREHLVEREREKIYMQNLYEDLKSDTAIYSSFVVNNSEFLNKIDSLETLMNSPARNTQLNKIYFVARTATMSFSSLFPNQRTFEQMKAAGNLRLISNQQVADSVSSYYNSLKELSNQNESVYNRASDYVQYMGKVFDAKILFQIYKEGKEPPLDSCKLLTEDPIVINELLTRAQYFYGSQKFQMRIGKEKSRSAENLIELIKKEYHFK